MTVMRGIVLLALLGFVQQVDDPRALVELLESDDPAVRDRAVSELKKQGERARPALEKSPSPHARDVLAWLDWEPLVPGAMKREDSAIVDKLAGAGTRRALVVEERMIPPAAIPRLILDPDPWVSHAAVRSYLAVDDRVQTAVPWSRRTFAAAIELLRRWPKHACDVACRSIHSKWLRETRKIVSLEADARDQGTIRGLLRSEAIEIRIIGACLLDRLGEDVEGELLALLPAAGEFQQDLIDALHGTKSKRAVPVLVPFLSDPNGRLRESVIGLLVGIGGTEVAKLLLGEIRSPRSPGWNLLNGLVQLDVREAVGPMVENLVSAGSLFHYSVHAIVRLAGEPGIDRILEKLLRESKERELSGMELGSVLLEGLLPVLDLGRARRLLDCCSEKDGRAPLARQLLPLVPKERLQPMLREVLTGSRDAGLLRSALQLVDDPTAVKAWAERTIKEEGHALFWEAAELLRGDPRPEPAVVARVGREKTKHQLLPAFSSEQDRGALVRMLESLDKDEGLSEILTALWKRGGPAGREVVLKTLENPDPSRRWEALDVVLDFEPATARRQLEAWLSSAMPPEQPWAVKVYSERFEAEATPLLRTLWDRMLPKEVRDELRRHFLVHGTPESATDLLHVLLSQGDEWALLRLLDWGDGEAEQVLEGRLREGSGTRLLFELGMERGLASCRVQAERWLQDPDPRSVEGGLRAMLRLEWCPDIQAVLRIARTETPTLRRTAVRLLRALRVREAAPLFRDILADSFRDFVLAGEAALGLERLGEHGWRAEAERLLEVPKLDWRAAALLDFVEGAEAFTAVPFERNPVLMHGTAVVSAEKLREWTRREVVLTEAAREIVKDGIYDNFEISMPGVLESFAWDKPLGAYWSGGKIVVCSGEEAVARRRSLR